MRQRTYISLALIILLAIVCGWLALSNRTVTIGSFTREVKVHLGLDLQGGLRVLLQADVPPGTTIDASQIDVARSIIEKRVNALGVAEPLIQVQGSNRIVVELPGIDNPDEAIKVFGGTGLLEFVDAGNTPLTEGQEVRTTGPSPANSCSNAIGSSATATPTVAASPTISPTTTISPTQSVTDTNAITNTTVYSTVMTGDCLDTASVQFTQNTNQPNIGFTLKGNGVKIFGDFTTANVGKYLAI